MEGSGAGWMGQWFHSTLCLTQGSLLCGATRWAALPALVFLFTEQIGFSLHTLEKFLECITLKTNTDKLVKHTVFAFLSPLELRAGDGESENSFS